MAAQPEVRGPSHIGWWGVLLIIALGLTYIAAIGTAAFYDHQTGANPPALQNATVSQMMSNVSAYLGKGVAVNGKVDQALSPEAITLANESSGGTTLLLVVGKQGTLPSGLKQGDTVQVAGTLGTFSRPQIEKDAGVTLDPQKFAQYEGKPVLVAQSASKPS